MRRTFFAVAVAAILAAPLVPTPAQASGRDDGPHIQLPSVASILPVAGPAVVSMPLAQIDAPAPAPAEIDPDLEVISQAAAKAFTTNGKVDWFVAAPLIVFVLVLISRRYLTKVIPWFGTTAGGYTLNITFSLALAFLKLGLKGGHFDATTAISLVFQVGYAFAISYATHHTQKDVREAIASKGELAAAAVTSGDDAAAKLAKLGQG